MIADSHVHVGYFNCRKRGGLCYYSPRRVVGVLNRCGVDEFVVSSTSAQMEGITAEGLISEAREMRRVAGARACQFLWVAWGLYETNQWRSLLDSGLYAGLKLHEHEGLWVEQHELQLRNVLDVARERGIPVQFHSGPNEHCAPCRLMRVVERYPEVRFDFAHCRPIDEMAAVIAQCDNVWTDTAYMSVDDIKTLPNFDWHHKLMFGTDLPVWQSREDVSLTYRYREYKESLSQAGLALETEKAFRSFIGKTLSRDL